MGPNGSGKSNVIDAMLFVFGRPAKHLRHSKLSELLHNSATYPDVNSAYVEVFFHDIVDTGEGDNDFTVIPDSEFSVRRTAYRNNTSKYFLGRREVKRKDVVELLKSKGVDLDNNRFLILQGEVEQISLMKPKSINAHDTGLLEYLEDIIGSNRHIEKIGETSTAVEALNEERGHKLQRVKAAEQERDSLENAKKEAEDFLDKERELVNKKTKLNKAQQYSITSKMAKHKDDYEKAKEKVAEFKDEVKEKDQLVSTLEESFKETQKEEKVAVKELNKAKEAFAAHERKDIKLREDLKALKANNEKLRGVKDREIKRIDENQRKQERFNSEKETAENDIVEAEKNIRAVQDKFDKICDEVKKSTQPIREQLEKKQEELLPFSQSINEARSNLEVNQANLKLLDEKLAAPQKNLDEAKASLDELKKEFPEANERFRSLKTQCEEHKTMAANIEQEIRHKRGQLEQMSSESSAMRRRIEEARSAREFSNTRSRLHNAVLSAARSNRLHGVVGRLGDLASVDDRYSTAVSAAAGANLDCIVVRTADNAQACIQFLRTENLGRATFIILEKVEYLRRGIESWTNSDQSRDGQRLYDFLNVPNPENRTAVYYALRDTLVGNTLEDARRMAFKPTRQNRVVTLSGELIESTGAMTGGGRGPTKYRLGNGQSTENEMDERSFRELCDNMERLRGDIQSLQQEIDQLEYQKRDALSQSERIDVEVLKCNAEVSSLQSRISNIEKSTIPSLKKIAKDAQARAQSGRCEDTKKRKEVEKAVSDFQKQLEIANVASEDIEKKIAELQQQILAAGGSKLDNVKAKLEEHRRDLSDLKSVVSTASSRSTAAKKAIAKAQKNLGVAEKDIKAGEETLSVKKNESEQMLEDAIEVMAKIQEAEGVHTEWAEKLEKIQADYTEVKGSLKSLRRKEVSLMEAADALKRLLDQDKLYLKALQKEEKALASKLKKLSLSSIGPISKVRDEESPNMDVDEEQENEEDHNDDSMDIDEGESSQQPDHEVAEEVDGKEQEEESSDELSADEKRKLETEISTLEGELASMSPNLSAIAEYSTKDREYNVQVGELDEVTKRRDESRRECDRLRKARLDEFMNGFSIITLKLKELYQMITLGGDAELELVDSLDPFSEGIVFSVRPPKKSWKNICNLSGGEKTLSSLALVFALHHFKPTPLYFLDEIDAALDFKNVSIVGNYIKERTKDAQFIIISLRNNMFELADRLVGIYKTNNSTKSVTINPKAFVMPNVQPEMTQVTQASKA